MTTQTTSPSRSLGRSRLGGLRARLQERREAHRAYRNLKRELATYRTPSDIEDLLSAVDRQEESPQVRQMRAILTSNLEDYRRRQRLAA